MVLQSGRRDADATGGANANATTFSIPAEVIALLRNACARATKEDKERGKGGDGSQGNGNGNGNQGNGNDRNRTFNYESGESRAVQVRSRSLPLFCAVRLHWPCLPAPAIAAAVRLLTRRLLRLSRTDRD